MTLRHPLQSRAPRWEQRRRVAVPALLALLAMTGCGGGAMSGSGGDVATEAEWRSLRQDRPDPLPGAARVSVSGVEFLGAYPWDRGAGITAAIGVSELVVAGLLRRQDVDFVERRRFAPAAAAERRGERRAPGQPAAGVSRSVDLSVTAVWIPLGADRATVEIRLARMETGDIDGATRVSVDPDADPVTLARAVVDGVLAVLEDLGRRPTWTDPLETGPNATPPVGVSASALASFLRGLAAEERWDWEGARRGYQSAATDSDFHEAQTALARAARLRLGGTLAES